jgi:hypothetical protein
MSTIYIYKHLEETTFSRISHLLYVQDIEPIDSEWAEGGRETGRQNEGKHTKLFFIFVTSLFTD